jgi:hypothetical protein
MNLLKKKKEKQIEVIRLGLCSRIFFYTNWLKRKYSECVTNNWTINKFKTPYKYSKIPAGIP